MPTISEMRLPDLFAGSFCLFHCLDGRCRRDRGLLMFGARYFPILAVSILFAGCFSRDPTGIASPSVIDTGTPIYAVAFVTETKLAAGGENGVVTIWNIDTGKAEMTLGRPGPEIRDIAVHPNGTMLAVARWNGNIDLWDLETAHKQRTLQGHDAAVSSVAFHPDGMRLASGGWDHKIIVWNIETGKTLNVCKHHDAPVLSVAFDNTGTYLISGGWDFITYVVDFETDKTLYASEPQGSSVTDVAFGDGSTIFYSTAEDTTYVIDFQTGEMYFELQQHSAGIWGILSMVPSNNADFVAAGGNSWNSAIYLWDISRKPPIKHILTGHSDAVWSLDFAPTGNLLASGSQDHTIRLWKSLPTE